MRENTTTQSNIIYGVFNW